LTDIQLSIIMNYEHMLIIHEEEIWPDHLSVDESPLCRA